MKDVIRFGRRGKLIPRYIGPFEILQRVGELDEGFAFVEESASILARDIRRLRSRDISVVKVQWPSRPVEKVTWEIERNMRAQYPYLFDPSDGDGIKIPKEEKFCPPARFWSATKAKALGIPVTRQKDSVTGDYFDTVNGMLFLKFKDGLLYNSVSISSIGYKIFELGDYVKVVSGGKEGATGTITSVKGHVVTVLTDKSINTFDVLADHVEENSEVAYSRVPPRSVSIPYVRPLPPPKKGNVYGDVRSASVANFRRPPSPQKKGYDFGRARRDPLLNARIKIRQGLHNGMAGRVVEVRGHRVRAELEAQMNHAYVDRSQIYEIGEADNSICPEEHYGRGVKLLCIVQEHHSVHG
ncbi:hypothetical protein CQW23_32318 [Capsicum baccatum]|uniref:KOW domain-containing protein n=1 Tax=Capsicum baccatum TaxID=33114 RepID=A0A2G2V4Z8_CAPBA|nr:hypothetical protein CQW23_32318 [Capsicum baccatum]